MPLIVEDGTLPAGANSFASVADADAYHAARLTAAWTDELAEVQKEAALIRASDWLNRKVMWNGRKASRSQRMAWPRSGVVTQDGEISPDEIPAEVVEACCELTGFLLEQHYPPPLTPAGTLPAWAWPRSLSPTTGLSLAWAVAVVVTTWMPHGPAIGNELENADSVIRIDGTAGKMRSCTIKFSTPTEFTDELGDRFPGQPIDTMRASSVDFEYYMRNDAAKRLREGSEGKEVRFDAEFGSEEGRKVVVACPRIKNKMPAINADSATVTLSQSSDILGVALEDAVEIILE